MRFKWNPHSKQYFKLLLLGCVTLLHLKLLNLYSQFSSNNVTTIIINSIHSQSNNTNGQNIDQTKSRMSNVSGVLAALKIVRAKTIGRIWDWIFPRRLSIFATVSKKRHLKLISTFYLQFASLFYCKFRKTVDILTEKAVNEILILIILLVGTNIKI